MMAIERMAGSFVTVTAVAETWKANNLGSVYWNGHKIDHYLAGGISSAVGILLKIFAGKKYDALADALIGGGTAAIIHDSPDLKNDFRNKQGIFKLLHQNNQARL